MAVAQKYPKVPQAQWDPIVHKNPLRNPSPRQGSPKFPPQNQSWRWRTNTPRYPKPNGIPFFAKIPFGTPAPAKGPPTLLDCGGAFLSAPPPYTVQYIIVKYIYIYIYYGRRTLTRVPDSPPKDPQGSKIFFIPI